MVNGLGEHIRERREALKTTDKTFSLRQVAQRVEVEPSYLSKVERGLEVPSEATVRLLDHPQNVPAVGDIVETGRVEITN
jgi:transcriptional regulator with XRE-family HTH domain